MYRKKVTYTSLPIETTEREKNTPVIRVVLSIKIFNIQFFNRHKVEKSFNVLVYVV